LDRVVFEVKEGFEHFGKENGKGGINESCGKGETQAHNQQALTAFRVPEEPLVNSLIVNFH
jgi:hypothetical protein